jgi:hypothetical protein
MTNIYFIRCGEFVKIGRGVDPEQRARDLQVGNPYEIEVIGSFCASEDEEARLHDAFRQFHHRAEWFFLSATIRAFITQHCNCNRSKQSSVRRSKTIAELRASIPDAEMAAGVRDFLTNRMEATAGAMTRAGVAYEAYLSWCEQEKRPAYTMKSFGRKVAELGIAKDETNNRVHYLGIHLKDAAA